MPAARTKPPPAWLSLDPALDPVAIAPIFARFGRVHLPGVLAPGGAERLYAALERTTPWSRLFNRAEKTFRSSLQEWAALSPGDRLQLEAEIGAAARTGFQFLFDSHNLSHAEAAGERLGVDVEAVLDFLNGPSFLAFARKLTGDRRIAKLDAQASRYLPGHFLTQHTDEQAGVDRLYAYVLNLTPEWRADWGGLLAFLDEDGHVAEAYTPKFNALNIFRVPQAHCVTAVSAFAGAPRYAVTGWMSA